jgi:hypothetical protein
MERKKKPIINFAEVSYKLTGKTDSIRSNQIPPKFRQVIDDCVKSVNDIISNYKKENIK